MSRAPRVTHEQIQMLVNYLENNRNMLSGKCHPNNTSEIDAHWKKVTILMNTCRGAKKSVEEWKRYFVEFKQTTRKKGHQEGNECNR